MKRSALRALACMVAVGIAACGDSESTPVPREELSAVCAELQRQLDAIERRAQRKPSAALLAKLARLLKDLSGDIRALEGTPKRLTSGDRLQSASKRLSQIGEDIESRGLPVISDEEAYQRSLRRFSDSAGAVGLPECATAVKGTRSIAKRIIVRLELKWHASELRRERRAERRARARRRAREEATEGAPVVIPPGPCPKTHQGCSFLYEEQTATGKRCVYVCRRGFR